MEPIDKWREHLEVVRYSSQEYALVGLYERLMRLGSEPEEKTPTFNEPRLKPIKP